MESAVYSDMKEGLGYGIASSVEYHEIFADGQCGVIATDIAVAQSWDRRFD